MRREREGEREGEREREREIEIDIEWYRDRDIDRDNTQIDGWTDGWRDVAQGYIDQAWNTKVIPFIIFLFLCSFDRVWCAKLVRMGSLSVSLQVWSGHCRWSTTLSCRWSLHILEVKASQDVASNWKPLRRKQLGRWGRVKVMSGKRRIVAPWSCRTREAYGRYP